MAADDTEMQVTDTGDWEPLVVMKICADDGDGDAA